MRRLALLVLGCLSGSGLGCARGGCERDGDCKGSRVCLNAECVEPLPSPPGGEPPTAAPVGAAPAGARGTPFGVRPYRVTIVSASLSPSKPNGQPWDADNSGPDAVVTVTVRGAGKGSVQSSKIQNSTAPQWNQQGVVTINRGDHLAISIVDKDLVADDPIASWDVEFTGPGPRQLSDGARGVNSLNIAIASAD